MNGKDYANSLGLNWFGKLYLTAPTPLYLLLMLITFPFMLLWEIVKTIVLSVLGIIVDFFEEIRMMDVDRANYRALSKNE